jgi:hypothetical protein
MRRFFASILLLTLVVLTGAVMSRASDIEVVRIQDRCDKATFPPEDGGHGAWRFHGTDHIEQGEPLRISNTGGEPHSFTEVSAFGTGLVPFLNPALPPGTPPAVPVGFATLEEANAATILFPGSERTLEHLSVGRHKFQCLIHPWMRLEVEVRK